MQLESTTWRDTKTFAKMWFNSLISNKRAKEKSEGKYKITFRQMKK